MKIEVNEFGVYEARWSERSGNRFITKRRSLKTQIRQEAEEALQRIKRGEPVRLKSMTVREAIEAHREMHLVPRGTERTVGMTFREFASKHFGAMPFEQITDDQVQDYGRKRMAGAYGFAAVSQGTVWKEVAAIQAALNFCVRKSLVTSHRVFRLHAVQKPEPRDVWMTEAQEQKMLDAVEGESLSVQLFTRMGLAYGVRKSAMLDLTWAQVDFDRGEIDFNVPGRRRTNKRRAKVPMTRTIRTLLEQIKGTMPGSKVLHRSTDFHYARFTKRIGMEWVTPHILKHTAVTLMLRAGTPIETVSTLTQTNIQTLMSVYRHHCQTELLQAAERNG